MLRCVGCCCCIGCTKNHPCLFTIVRIANGLIDVIYSPSLAERSCGNPGVPANGKKIGDAHKYGKTVNFTCNTGYTMHGSSSRTCQESTAKWTGTQPTCQSKTRPSPFCDFSWIIKLRLMAVCRVMRLAISNAWAESQPQNSGLFTISDHYPLCSKKGCFSFPKHELQRKSLTSIGLHSKVTIAPNEGPMRSNGRFRGPNIIPLVWCSVAAVKTLFSGSSPPYVAALLLLALLLLLLG